MKEISVCSAHLSALAHVLLILALQLSASCLGLNQLQPHSHPPFYGTGNSRNSNTEPPVAWNPVLAQHSSLLLAQQQLCHAVGSCVFLQHLKCSLFLLLTLSATWSWKLMLLKLLFELLNISLLDSIRQLQFSLLTKNALWRTILHLRGQAIWLNAAIFFL